MTYYEEDTPDESEKMEEIKEENETHTAINEDEVKKLVEELGGTFEPPKYNLYRDYDRHLHAQERADERHQEMMEMLGGIFIQMSRIYDVLLMQSDTNSVIRLTDAHSKGKLIADPPILEEDAWS